MNVSNAISSDFMILGVAMFVSESGQEWSRIAYGFFVGSPQAATLQNFDLLGLAARRLGQSPQQSNRPTLFFHESIAS